MAFDLVLLERFGGSLSSGVVSLRRWHILATALRGTAWWSCLVLLLQHGILP